MIKNSDLNHEYFCPKGIDDEDKESVGNLDDDAVAAVSGASGPDAGADGGGARVGRVRGRGERQEVLLQRPDQREDLEASQEAADKRRR